MLRTVHVTNAWHEASGGVATFYRALLETAGRTGRRACIVVPGATTRVDSLSAYTRIYQVRAPRAPFNPEYRIFYPYHYLLPSSPVSRILREEAPDVVEICDKFTLPYLGGLLRTGMLPGLVKKPAVVGMSCDRFDDTVAAYTGFQALPRLLGRWYLKWLYFPLADHHIAMSDYIAEELERPALGHKVRRGVWVRNPGVDVTGFHPSLRNEERRRELRERAGAGEDEILLLYAGRLAPEKNLDLLIQTLRWLARHDTRRYKLLVAGDGSLRREFLCASTEAVPGAVFHLGHLANRERLASLYANCDVFLHPNPREPFGIAPLEAMAAGLPLVVPDRGGVTSYASVSNSWPAPPTARGFGEAVMSVFEDAEERAGKTRRARATAEEFAWPAACARLLELYEVVHCAVQTGAPALAGSAHFYSTPGDWLGRQVSTTAARSNSCA